MRRGGALLPGREPESDEKLTSTMIKQAACDAPMLMRKIQSLSLRRQIRQESVVECKLQYGGGNRSGDSVVMPREGVWRFEGQKFYVPANVNGFDLLVVGRRKDDPIVLQFISKLSKCCNDFGMGMPEWPDRVEAVQVVADVDPFAKLKHEAEAAGKDCELIIIAILPQKSTQFYSEVKRIGEVQLGLITQVVPMKSVMDVTRKGKMHGAKSRLESEHENGRHQLERARRRNDSQYCGPSADGGVCNSHVSGCDICLLSFLFKFEVMYPLCSKYAQISIYSSDVTVEYMLSIVHSLQFQSFCAL